MEASLLKYSECAINTRRTRKTFEAKGIFSLFVRFFPNNSDERGMRLDPKWSEQNGLFCD